MGPSIFFLPWPFTQFYLHPLQSRSVRLSGVGRRPALSDCQCPPVTDFILLFQSPAQVPSIVPPSIVWTAPPSPLHRGSVREQPPGQEMLPEVGHLSPTCTFVSR